MITQNGHSNKKKKRVQKSSSSATVKSLLLLLCVLLPQVVHAFNPFKVLSDLVQVPSNTFRRDDSVNNSKPGFTGALFKLVADNFIRPEMEKRKIQTSEKSVDIVGHDSAKSTPIPSSGH